MEFKLNKIDPELRQRINAQTSEGIVHTKKGISVNKDKNKDSRQQQHSHKEEAKEKFVITKYAGAKDKFTVDTIKVQNVEVQAVRDENSVDENNYKGSYIDSRR